jgi:hypothetical protein
MLRKYRTEGGFIPHYFGYFIQIVAGATQHAALGVGIGKLYIRNKYIFNLIKMENLKELNLQTLDNSELESVEVGHH